MEDAQLATVVGEYRGICQELGFKPIAMLEESLAASPDKIDLSTILFPPAHFESIVLLVDRRCEIEKLVLSGVQVSTEQLLRLFDVMKCSSVREIVLRDVLLGPECGQALKNLAIECEDLVCVDVSGSMLSKNIESLISIQVEINRMQRENRMLHSCRAVEPESRKTHVWRVESWEEENLVRPRRISSILEGCLSVREVMLGAMRKCLPFCDTEFPPHVALKDPKVTWARVSSLLQDAKKQNCCSGEVGPLSNSVINDTRNLCAALNVVQQVHYLRKQLCIWRLPDIGFFAFRFFVKDTSVDVVVDDEIPLVNNVPGGIHYVQNSGDYWGCLVEKAFAKLHGGYEKIAGVGFAYALSVLTGGVCFAINWRALKQHFNETEMFRFLRQLMNAKRVLASICFPKNKMKTRFLEENGVCPNMSYVWTAAESFTGEGSSLSHAVQLSCPNEIKIKSVIPVSQLNQLQGSMLPRCWWGFEECLVHFEVSCLLLWPQSDPLNSHKIVVEFSCNCSGGPDYTSTFATNPSFVLTKTGHTTSEIMLLLRREDPYNGVSDGWIQIHVHKGNRKVDEVEQRHGICPRNELISTRKAYGEEVAILIQLGGDEKLQITTSASSICQCTLTATSIHAFQLLPLPNYHVSIFKGVWNSDSQCMPSLTLINKGREMVKKIVVALSQEPVDKRQVGIGVEVWSDGDNVGDCSSGANQPLCTTDIRSELLVVFPIGLSIKPNECFRIIPVMKRKRKVAFSMSVYCATSLQVMGKLCKQA